MDNWQDLHNDNGGDDTQKDIVVVTIDVSPRVEYRCVVEVETCRGIPCNTETLGMSRDMYTPDGDFFDEMIVDYVDFPHYISEAAAKKALEMR